jgi:hypothetical protein
VALRAVAPPTPAAVYGLPHGDGGGEGGEGGSGSSGGSGGGGGGSGSGGEGDWLGRFRAYLAANDVSDQNQRNTMKVVEALASGEGIHHPLEPRNVFAHGQCISLRSDLAALREQARGWLSREDDSSRGWKLHTPLNKLRAFQAHERGDAAEGRPVFRPVFQTAATADVDADADVAANAPRPPPRPPPPPPSGDSDDDFCVAPSQTRRPSRPSPPGQASAYFGHQVGAAQPSSDSEEDRPLHSRKRQSERVEFQYD